MQALWLENQQLHYRNDVPIPTPQVGEALVKIHLAGICATDLELINGYYPYTGILGHEFVGEIVNTPNRERVVGEINVGCGQCQRCQVGQVNHCQQRKVLGISQLNGAFAEYLTLPLKNLIPVPANIPNEAAVFTEPLAAALAIQEQITIRPTHQVLVVGAGRLGQLIAQTLKLTGCHLHVIARYQKQKQLLADGHISWFEESSVPRRFFDVVVEATSTPTGFALAQQAVRPRGTIVLKSTYPGGISANFSALVVDEVHLVGSRCGPFAPALRLLESQLVNPRPLIDAIFPLAAGLQAFEKARQPGILKVLLSR
jgi:threonine dehydrogenase-like Zn-dependent dehydrogenase